MTATLETSALKHMINGKGFRLLLMFDNIMETGAELLLEIKLSFHIPHPGVSLSKLKKRGVKTLTTTT